MAALQGGGAVSHARGNPAASKSLSPKVSGNISLGIAKFLDLTNFLGVGINRAALEREAEVGALVVEGIHLPLLPRNHNLRDPVRQQSVLQGYLADKKTPPH